MIINVETLSESVTSIFYIIPYFIVVILLFTALRRSKNTIEFLTVVKDQLMVDLLYFSILGFGFRVKAYMSYLACVIWLFTDLPSVTGLFIATLLFNLATALFLVFDPMLDMLMLIFSDVFFLINEIMTAMTNIFIDTMNYCISIFDFAEPPSTSTPVNTIDNQLLNLAAGFSGVLIFVLVGAIILPAFPLLRRWIYKLLATTNTIDDSDCTEEELRIQIHESVEFTEEELLLQQLKAEDNRSIEEKINDLEITFNKWLQTELEETKK